MNTTFADGYNIRPTPADADCAARAAYHARNAAPTAPEPPTTPPAAAKPRTWGLFSFGIQWAIISGIVCGIALYNAHRKLDAIPKWLPITTLSVEDQRALEAELNKLGDTVVSPSAGEARQFKAALDAAGATVVREREIPRGQVPAKVLAAFAAAPWEADPIVAPLDKVAPRISENETLATIAPKSYWTSLWAGGAAVLFLALAAVGLVWGVFQHVLKTIVRIVRHGN